MTPTNIIDQLKRDEGLLLKPYKDSVGKLTIGYGRNLNDVGVSAAEAEAMLASDVETATAHLHAYLPWTDSLDEVRRAVLVNMTFNMGIFSLVSFHSTLACLRVADYAAAAKQMLLSLWAKQVGDRAQRLAQQMETGQWV